MKALIYAAVLGTVGYFGGAYLTAAVLGQSPTYGVAVTFGFILGLNGWLLGIGVWKAWVREWLGKAPDLSVPEGWKRYLNFSVDHKVIGSQYLITFISVFLLGGLMAMLMRTELMNGAPGFLDGNGYNKVMSMHGILMVAVAVAGILGSFGNYLVPLMIGADDMAFPRLNALSFWLVPPVAVGLLLAPLLGSFSAGWTAYPPLSVINDDGQILFNLAIITFGLSSVLGGLNILTTVITMRAPGMTWGRLPIFVWGAVSASLLSLLFTQFFAGALILILLDRIAGTSYFAAAEGGTALLYEHIFWFYSHPAVYIMVLPAFGVALEVITNLVRKPLFAYKAVVAGMLGIALMSGVVWAHHMFTSGMADVLHGPFMILTELISIPTGLIFLGAVGTLWQGRMAIKTPLLLAIGWLFNFAIGGITGIFLADVATDLFLHDTYFVVAHFHYTIIGGSIFGLLAGAFYWFPKITGRMYAERAGKIFSVWVLIAFNLTFLPMFWLGTNGMNRRVAAYPSAYDGVNSFVTMAAFALGAAFVFFAGILVWSAIKGEKAPDNPWNAHTLEWMVSSPPPEHNFPTQPEVVGHPYVYGQPGAKHAVIRGGGDREMQLEPTGGGGE